MPHVRDLDPLRCDFAGCDKIAEKSVYRDREGEFGKHVGFYCPSHSEYVMGTLEEMVDYAGS